MDIFKKRVNLKPYEYPDLIPYADSINNAFWLVSEFNFTKDIQDFKVNLDDKERSIIERTMLAISQIEVNVKTFWADLYKRLPKPEVAMVGMTFAECHADGTEVLTPNGWVNFKDISIGDSVIQYHKDGTLSVTKVLNKVDKYYSGVITNFPKNNRQTALTPGHRLLYKTKSGQLVEKRVGEINNLNSDMKIPETGVLSSGHIDTLSDLDRLKIAIQADGSARYSVNKDGEKIRRGLSTNSHTYEISVKKSRKKDKLISLLNSLEIVYREFNTDREEYIKFEVDMDKDFDYKTFDWVNVEDKTSTWCKSFIEELAEWDGYRLVDKVDCKIKYSSTMKSCIDKAQLVGICAGYKTNINKYIDNRKYSYLDVYTLSFVNNREFTGTNSKRVDTPYEGQVRCITVDSGFIITRYKDTTFISGNSEVRHQRAYAHLLEVLGLNDKFEEVIDVPEIRDRIKYLNKYLDGTTSRDNREFTKSVMLFSMFVEHVSLFSQFLIMMSFNKDRNLLSGVSNVVEATSLEEQIHGLFGAKIINIIREENPEWFGDDMDDIVRKSCSKAMLAEVKLLDWIFEKGELEFLPKKVIIEFIKNRFNIVLTNGGFKPLFEIDTSLTESTNWFEIQLKSTPETDFFYKIPNSYNKKSKSIQADDLF